MPTVHPIQTSFIGGELSPLMLARVDFAKYRTGVAVLENFLLKPQGPAARRPGFRFVNEVKDSTKKVRLLRFEFNDEDAYILEAGEFYFRFYRAGARIEEPPGTPVEIATPYTEAQLAGLQWAQRHDTLYLVHKDHAPRKLIRSSHTSWTLSTVDWVNGPYLDENVDAAKKLKVTGAAYTKGSSLTLQATGHTPFQAGHVGSLWELRSGTDRAWFTVTAFTDSDTVTVEAKVDVPMSLQNTDTATWREGAWSAVRGWPRAITVLGQRLWLAGTTFEPDRAWGSVVNSPEDMTAGPDADDAVAFSAASGEVNLTRWLAPSGTRLAIGTLGGIVTIAGGRDTGITPTTFQITPEPRHRCADVAAIPVGSAVLFIQQGGRKLRELVYSFDIDSYVAADLTILSEHITKGPTAATTGLIELAYQPDPDGIVWGVRADGVLLACTYLREHEIVGWGRHVVAGSKAGPAVVESVAAIPNGTATADELWIVVQRTINGAVKRYIERLDPEADAYVDSYLPYSGAPATVFAGLAHLEGETVQIRGDGATYPEQVVTGGQVTIDPAASVVEIGLKYTSRLKTLRPEGGNPLGTAQGVHKRFSEIVLRIHDSRGGRVNGNPILSRSAVDLMDVAPPVRTGDEVLANAEGWDLDAQNEIVQDAPQPFVLLGIFGRLGVEP